MNNCCGNDQGFTLIEIIATMVILSILAGLAIPRYISLDESAKQRAIVSGIAELNGRETLTWSNIKISESGWIDDNRTYSTIDLNLGNDYLWASGPDEAGGTLRFKNSNAVPLTRTASTSLQPGHWEP